LLNVNKELNPISKTVFFFFIMRRMVCHQYPSSWGWRWVVARHQIEKRKKKGIFFKRGLETEGRTSPSMPNIELFILYIIT
jgi:hypothetical protein